MNPMKKNYSPDPKYGYVGIDEASKLLGLSKSTIYKMTARGEIPCYRPTRIIYFKITELQAWIEGNYNLFSDSQKLIND
jgi:excisionase family DNA binding protein